MSKRLGGKLPSLRAISSRHRPQVSPAKEFVLEVTDENQKALYIIRISAEEMK